MDNSRCLVMMMFDERLPKKTTGTIVSTMISTTLIAQFVWSRGNMLESYNQRELHIAMFFDALQLQRCNFSRDKGISLQKHD
jgi:hypothetical protein